MQLHDLTPAPGSTKNRKRVGPWQFFGSRHHFWPRPEGPGFPLWRHQGCRLRGWPDSAGYAPAQASGFRNPRRIEYTAVNVERLERKFEDGAVIDGAALKAARITKSEFEPVKVLGNGELTKKFTVKVDKVSASAQAKIEAAGGKVELPC